MMNVHPIVANLISQQTLVIAVKQDVSAKFLNDLRLNTSNSLLQTEDGRANAFKNAMLAVFGNMMRDYDMFNRVNGSTAVIPVHGSLINRFNSSWSFLTGYSYIKSAVMQAINDDSISTILLDVNSNGGEVSGCFEAAGLIAEMKQHKPIHAVVDSNCHSAAYAIASACTSIIATPSSSIGSIGVVAIHASYEKYLENEGVAVTIIQAGDKKTQGNPYQNLTDEAKADIQQRIDNSYSEFTSFVAENRSIEKEAVIKTQAACYTSQEAKERGLIDDVMTVEQAVQFLTKPKDITMSVDNQPKQSDKAEGTQTNTAAATERQRIQAIMSSPAASGQTALANHLAFMTSMSAEEAIAILQASATDQEQAKAAEAEKKANDDKEKTENKKSDKAEVSEPNYLAEAMAKQGSPNVGADKGGEDMADSNDIAQAAAFANVFNY